MTDRKLKPRVMGMNEIIDLSPIVELMWDQASPNYSHVRPRRPKDITTIFVHHSGRDGREGSSGALASCRFTKDRAIKSYPKTKRFAPPGYHFWIPREPTDGEVFQLWAVTRIAFHTQGCNNFGIGVVLQGNLGKREPTAHQEETLYDLLDYLGQTWRLERPAHSLGRHSQASKWGGRNKSACPGKGGERILDEYLAHRTHYGVL